ARQVDRANNGIRVIRAERCAHLFQRALVELARTVDLTKQAQRHSQVDRCAQGMWMTLAHITAVSIKCLFAKVTRFLQISGIPDINRMTKSTCQDTRMIITVTDEEAFQYLARQLESALVVTSLPPSHTQIGKPSQRGGLILTEKLP